MKRIKESTKLLLVVLAIIAAILCAACGKKQTGQVRPAETAVGTAEGAAEKAGAAGAADAGRNNVIDEDGEYYDVENVVLYIHTYGRLPKNYITKKEAKALGWEGGSVEAVAPDKAIGGDHFGNYEGQLPEAAGRKYTECDIDTHGYKNRGSRRLIFSNDGLYFYTGDHYENFDELYVDANGTVQWK